ncbi:type III restriction protein res subunit [Gloeocapsa sp. PCC 7428]|uniref:DEAD/DEAH box helicase n=1 Tax=Gloeocapsa sp. PCC 7428 TaxID=1173026 RepID=UPI0002A5BCBD|nr:DEAD/DEAH box helicase [Gloeocapsa sp. PCC 7428]AFZ29913.1 type III restriction protein res subunit [Gloeocapsa sp. PCC 7428]
MQFDDLLSRADDETLQALLGNSVVRLLRLLDASLATPSYLREVLLGLYTRESLLLSKDSRTLLLDLLRPEQARILAAIMQVPVSGDVFQSLKEAQVRRGSERERALFDFFELAVPQNEIYVETPALELSASAYHLFAHQRDAARKVKYLLKQEPRRVLLHMPTGAGKTRTAMNIIADHLRSLEPTLVIWLAYSEELCEQAATEFQQAWKYLGDREISVYRFWGDRELDLDGVQDGIVIAGLSKVYNRAKRSIQFINQLGSRSSLVIIDEAHQAIAETYKLVLDTLVVPYQHTALLGLTATPGRTWADINVDTELSAFFARRKVTLQVSGYNNPIDYLVSEQYLARVNYRSLFYQSGLNLSDKDLKHIEQELELPKNILNHLAEDEQRNLRIILEVEDLGKRHQRILVFAISVEHTKLLAAVLRTRGWRADAITGNTPPEERSRLISTYRDDALETKILCNYGVLTTGFDAPRTSAAVIARPTKSLVLYSQMVGRAIRGVKAGGNETAEIVTVVDSELPGFGSVAEAFSNWEDVWI